MNFKVENKIQYISSENGHLLPLLTMIIFEQEYPPSISSASSSEDSDVKCPLLPDRGSLYDNAGVGGYSRSQPSPFVWRAPERAVFLVSSSSFDNLSDSVECN